MKYDLLVLGGSVLDIYLKVGRFPITAGSTIISPTMVALPGGSSALAIIASRLGLKVAYLDRVGDDPFASLLLRDLKRNKVETAHITVIKGGQTALSVNLVDGLKRHSFVGYLGPGSDLSVDDVDESLVLNSRAIFFEGYNLAGKAQRAIMKALEIVSSNSSLVFFDPGPLIGKIPHLDKFMSMSSTIFLNESESASYFGKPLGLTTNKGLQGKDVVIKMGERGAVLVSQGSLSGVRAMRLKNIESTIGAGDAFDAAYIAAVLHGRSKLEALKMANLVASIRISMGLDAINAKTVNSALKGKHNK